MARHYKSVPPIFESTIQNCITISSHHLVGSGGRFGLVCRITISSDILFGFRQRVHRQRHRERVERVQGVLPKIQGQEKQDSRYSHGKRRYNIHHQVRIHKSMIEHHLTNRPCDFHCFWGLSVGHSVRNPNRFCFRMRMTKQGGTRSTVDQERAGIEKWFKVLKEGKAKSEKEKESRVKRDESSKTHSVVKVAWSPWKFVLPYKLIR